MSGIGFTYGVSVTVCLLLCWLWIFMEYIDGWIVHDNPSVRRRIGYIVYLVILCANLATTWVLAWNCNTIPLGWLVMWGLIWVGPVALGLFMVLAEAMNEY